MAMERNPPTEREQSKSTWFCLETYLPHSLLEAWCEDAIDNGRIRHYAYILHDKDEATPHTHLVVNTVKQQEETTVRNWIVKYGVECGSNQNTLSQVCKNPTAISRYLTHSDQKSMEKGKHQYSVDEVVTDSLEWYNKTKTATEQRERKDYMLDIINDIIDNVPYRELIKKYGRDFVIHWKQYLEMARLILIEEGGKSRGTSELNTDERTTRQKATDLDKELARILPTIA